MSLIGPLVSSFVYIMGESPGDVSEESEVEGKEGLENEL